MSDLRISELSPLLPADAEPTDDLAVVDYSASETKKLSLAGAVATGLRVVPNGTIPGTKLIPESVTGTEIASGSITRTELAPDAVVTLNVADLAITNAKLAAGIDGAKLAVGSVGAAQLSANAITAGGLADGAVGTAAVADGAITNAKLAAGIDGAKLTAGSVDNTKLAPGIDGAKVVADSITARELAANAVTAVELADGAVDTAAIQLAAVTNDRLAAGIDGAKLTAGSVANAALAAGIDGAKLVADSVTTTQIAANAITASELADGAVDTVSVVDGAITNAKLAAGIDGAKLVANSVTAAQIGPDAITASELADGAVDTAAVQDAAITNAKLAAGIDGAKLTADSVSASKIPAASLDRGLDKTSGAIGHTNTVTAGSRNGITYDAQGHVTGTVALGPTDLPLATATQVGGVSVPAASGLSVSGIGALAHTDTITPATVNGLTINSTGHITAAVPLASSDLPTATQLAKGGVIVPGPELTINAAGAIAHADSGVAAGTYSKVTVSAKGHVTAGAALSPADIPNLDASKITGGTFDAARIKDGSITRQMLADYAITYIQEANPPTAGNHAGTLWLQESTGQLRMWNSNSWFPIGFGRLSAENLRYCGTFNAATGAISGVTQFGTTEGFKLGDQVPAASDKLAGVYLVVATPGNGTTATAGVTYDNGDWILCNGATAGWTRIDTLSGGGGGGGATHLNDLLDVTISTGAVAGDMLQLAASGQWLNVSELDGGAF